MLVKALQQIEISDRTINRTTIFSELGEICYGEDFCEDAMRKHPKVQVGLKDPTHIGTKSGGRRAVTHILCIEIQIELFP